MIRRKATTPIKKKKKKKKKEKEMVRTKTRFFGFAASAPWMKDVVAGR
jgi:hypothetical protein